MMASTHKERIMTEIAKSAAQFVSGEGNCWGERRWSNSALIMDTRGHDGVTVWEAAGAGKRGKKVRRVSVSFAPHTYGDSADINHKLLVAVTTAKTIEDVQAAAEVARLRFVAELCAGKFDGFGFYSAKYVETKRGIDVPACGEVELSWGSDDFTVTFSPQGFRLADHTDRHNDPRVIPRGAAQARKAHAILMAKGQEAVERMTLKDVWSMLSSGGVSCQYYCAAD
jgi:hypothetical protein